eukprot:TRINITY_DN11185_c0_g1_i1.p1 TRINITY_DN11185_c0_g1~~TRINITY_DN11185_c0_g1_i1.p1  ORF type:complete len:474 (-),score=78.60 TRINITY_DN11185_c0_g1_i1:209-1573(-)
MKLVHLYLTLCFFFYFYPINSIPYQPIFTPPPFSVLPLSVTHQGLFTVKMEIGTPPRKLSMAINLDSVSPYYSTVFVNATTCPTSTNCFDLSLSSTYEDPNILVKSNYCSVGEDFISFSGTATKSYYSFCVSDYAIEQYYNPWYGYDGILAISIQRFPQDLSNVTQLLPKHSPPIFSLDLLGRNLYLGGYHLWPGLQWGEAQATDSGSGDNGQNQLVPIFGLFFCGVNLMGKDNCYYPATISTMTGSLVLPNSLFSRLTAWLNAECSTPTKLLVCRFSNVTRQGSSFSLPNLEFSLSFDGPTLEISLNSLIIHRQYSSDSLTLTLAIMSWSGQELVFGSLVLSRFYVVMDLGNQRIALAPRDNGEIKPSIESCAPPTICSGDEEFVAAENNCQSMCVGYYFQYYDHVTDQCQIRMGVRMFGGLALALMVVIEIVETEAYYRLIRQVRELRLFPV